MAPYREPHKIYTGKHWDPPTPPPPTRKENIERAHEEMRIIDEEVRDCRSTCSSAIRRLKKRASCTSGIYPDISYLLLQYSL